VATTDELDKLPPDLAWQRDGHVTDIVVASVADGEAGIVPEDALSHLEHCEHCTSRLGAEALLSAHAGELLQDLASPAVVRAPAKAPVNANGKALPKGAVIGAFLIAAVGATPAIFDSVARLPALLRALGRAIVLLAHSTELVVKSDMGTTLAWAASLVLLVSGLVVSRLSRVRRSNGLAQEGGV
jgi:hypothetical protein